MKRLLCDLVTVPFDKIREGFFKVVMPRSLREMTPSLLEIAICGYKKVDNVLYRSISFG